MEFGLLGSLLIRDGARLVPVSAPRQRVLLAALLLNAGRVVSLDALAEILWEGQPPAGARGALHSAVQRLRVTLGPSGANLIETQPPGYLIKVDDELDVRRFASLAARGHAAVKAEAWAEAARLLREALGLWRGEPLADVPSRLLRSREVPAIEDQRLQVLAARIDADLHLGRHAEVVAELRQAVAAHPLQEQFHAQLMLSLYRSGRSADALAAYQDVRRALADELGIDPGPELRLLHQHILAADSGLLLPSGAEPADTGGHRAVSDRRAAGERRVAGDRPAEDAIVPRQLPAAMRHFTGRAEELTALTALAAEAAGASHTPVIAVIEGTAGIGKTTLALRFAHEIAGQFPDGQLYVNLRGFDPAGPPMPVTEAIMLFLEALATPAMRIPAGLAGQAALYRSLMAGKRMLVLLDNARDVDQVRPLIPASPGCMVIVTSRSELTSLVATEGAFPLTLDVLAYAEARELLTRHLGAQRVEADRGEVNELIQMCARLPLALSIAAARTASRPQVSLSSVTADLLDARRRLDALDAGHEAANVRAVLSWSYRQLDAPAARLFRLLGLRIGADISAAAAASLAGLPLDEAHRRLAELTRAHLLAETAADRFSSHDLLRAYSAELTQSSDSAAERREATGRLLGHYLHTGYSAALKLHPTRRPITLDPLLPGVTPEQIADAGQALSWFEAENRVLIAAVGRALEDGFDAHAWQIPWAISRFLDMRGRWHDWASIAQLALTAAQRLGDQAIEAAAHQRLGYASGRLGRYDDAHAHLELALRIHTERDDQAGQAYAHNSVAITLSYQGRYDEALSRAQHALTCYVAAGDLPGQALALNSIGWFHAILGDHAEALSACGRALAMFRELGSSPEDVANVLDSLGYAHQQAGHHAEATDCYQQAIGLHREIGSRWGVAETLGHLGDVRHAVGDPAAARTAWEEALTILDDLHHPDRERIRNKLKDLGTAPVG